MGLLVVKFRTDNISVDHRAGWFAARTCSLEHCVANVFPNYVDNLDFWSGYTRGAYLMARGT